MQSSKNSQGASKWRKCTKWHLKVKIFTKYRAQYKESLQLFDNLYCDNENKISIDVMKKVVMCIVVIGAYLVPLKGED